MRVSVRQAIAKRLPECLQQRLRVLPVGINEDNKLVWRFRRVRKPGGPDQPFRHCCAQSRVSGRNAYLDKVRTLVSKMTEETWKGSSFRSPETIKTNRFATSPGSKSLRFEKRTQTKSRLEQRFLNVSVIVWLANTCRPVVIPPDNANLGCSTPVAKQQWGVG